MLPRLLLISTLAALFLAPLAAHADDTASWYDVEVIVFAQKDPQQALASESWPDQVPQPDLAHAIHTLDPIPGLLSAYQKLPANDSDKLDAVWRRLQKSGRYEALVHMAWVQPGFPRKASPPVDINPPAVDPDAAQTSAGAADSTDQPLVNVPAGDTTAQSQNPPAGNMRPLGSGASTTQGEHLVNVAPGDVLPVDGSADAAAQQKPVKIPPPITGTVTMSLDTYLHLDLHLLYTIPGQVQQPTPAQQEQMRQDVLDSLIQGDITSEQAQSLLSEPQAPAYKQYLLDEVRKVKLDEIDYFDNPLFGALVMVSRHPLPASMQPPAAPDEKDQPQPAGEQPGGGK